MIETGREIILSVYKHELNRSYASFLNELKSIGQGLEFNEQVEQEFIFAKEYTLELFTVVIEKLKNDAQEVVYPENSVIKELIQKYVELLMYEILSNTGWIVKIGSKRRPFPELVEPYISKLNDLLWEKWNYEAVLMEEKLKIKLENVFYFSENFGDVRYFEDGKTKTNWFPKNQRKALEYLYELRDKEQLPVNAEKFFHDTNLKAPHIEGVFKVRRKIGNQKKSKHQPHPLYKKLICSRKKKVSFMPYVVIRFE